MNKFFIPLLLVFAAGYIFWHFKTTLPPVGVHVPAKAAPQVRPIPKVFVTPKKVKVYVQKAKDTLDLSVAMQNDANIHVVESTRVAADDRPSTVTTVLNAETGETTTLYRREPLPWLAFRGSGALGLSHDLVSSLRTLYVRQDLLQSKVLVLSAIASIRSDRDKVAAVTLEYRW